MSLDAVKWNFIECLKMVKFGINSTESCVTVKEMKIIYKCKNFVNSRLLSTLWAASGSKAGSPSTGSTPRWDLDSLS